jgi:hypothetical protein
MIAAPAISHVDDAAGRMSRLARHEEMALEVAVEGDAIAEEIVDARRGVGDQQTRDLLIDRAGAGGDRVGEMALDRVAFTHGGGNAALRPGGGGALPDRCRGQHRHRPRRQPQRAEEAGETAAHDDDAGFRRMIACHDSRPHPPRHPGASRGPSIAEREAFGSDGFQLPPE